MLTLFHSPNSRSTRVVALLHELGALDAVRIETVTVARRDGSGATAMAYSVLAFASTAAFFAVVIYGVVIIVKK